MVTSVGGGFIRDVLFAVSFRYAPDKEFGMSCVWNWRNLPSFFGRESIYLISLCSANRCSDSDLKQQAYG